MEHRRTPANTKAGFRSHLMTYIIVISFLAIINLFTAPETLWFVWPMMGWGIGIFVHAMNVYVFNRTAS